MVAAAAFAVAFCAAALIRMACRGEAAPGSRPSIEDRQKQYGPSARKRLSPHFTAANVPYPPARIVLVGLKDEKRLEVWAAGEDGLAAKVRDYPILAASGTAGPKLREGDRQVPEGIYRIESLNPNSRYHLALRVNYPSDEDRGQAKKDGRDRLGGDIMIHGSDGSVGCLAMGDEAAEDLFILAADTGIDRITVLLCPWDLRTREPPADDRAWVQERYRALKSALESLSVGPAR